MSKDKKEEKKQAAPAADEIKEEVKTEEPEIEAKEADGKKPEAEKAEEKKPEEKKGKEKKEEKKPDLKAEMDALNDKYLRICAEYDNFRKRSQKEKDSLYGDVKAETLKSFLPVYDNLVRALAQSTEDEAYRRGAALARPGQAGDNQKIHLSLPFSSPVSPAPKRRSVPPQARRSRG